MSRLLAAGALVAFFVVLFVIVTRSRNNDNNSTTTTTSTRTTARTTPTRPTTTARNPGTPRIKLAAVGAYDPEGDGHENDDLAPQAVDGDTATFWKTEHYHSFWKTGVGLVLDARRARPITKRDRVDRHGGRLGRDPGRTEPERAVPPRHRREPLTGKTIFRLAKRPIGRYVVVWITALPPSTGEAHVTEVRAFGPAG